MTLFVVESRHRHSSGEWTPSDYAGYRTRAAAELDARNYQRRHPRDETRIVIYERRGP